MAESADAAGSADGLASFGPADSFSGAARLGFGAAALTAAQPGPWVTAQPSTREFSVQRSTLGSFTPRDLTFHP